MRLFHFVVPLLLGPLALMTSCAGSSGGGSGFSIVSCSLGCSGSGVGGDGQITCGIQDVFVNGELRIAFSAPVDPTSLTVFTVQMTESATGKTPSADRFVDPTDSKTLVYRPELTFDSSGSPVFGLLTGASYTLKLPGLIEDSGDSYVRSVSGTANQHRMLCTVEASLGILDPKPGTPTATVLVDVVTAYDPVSGDPSAFDLGVPADGALSVFRFSKITIEFDDLMNPATLVNPVTGESATLSIRVDPDGLVSDPSDQSELGGVFSISLDQDLLTTTVVFETILGFPSAGSDIFNPRKIIVETSPSISDLGGNPLSNFGEITFVPEVILFDQVVVEEEFDSEVQEDVVNSGAGWADAVTGALLPGSGGGSGKHGSLHLQSGQVLTLNSDFEDFSGISDVGIWDPATGLESTFDGSSFTPPPVTDGIFEFSSINIETGSRLNFTGANPVRLFVRGEALVRGLISVAGIPGVGHSSLSVFGQASQPAGPAGGLGGEGGRLPTWEGFEAVPGTFVPPDPKPPAPLLAELNGFPGIGVPDNLLTPSGSFGEGDGGIAWPQPTAEFPAIHMPVDPHDLSGTEWDLLLLCLTKMKGSVGAGGAFGLNATPGLNNPIPGGIGIPPEPPLPLGGLASDFGLGIGSDPDLPQRTLSPEDGWLHGGAGGGGGGSGIANTKTNGTVLTDCEVTLFGGLDAEINGYAQHSSPAGGAGGGALQLQAGRRAVIDGSLDASGGDGGSKSAAGQSSAGGGGSGGALLVQAPNITLGSGPDRLNVRGGEGGFGAGASVGGAGGAGLIRLERNPPEIALGDIGVKIGPTDQELVVMGASLGDIVSSGTLTPPTVGPNGRNGVQSCWLRPEGNFFLLTFIEDVVDSGTMEITDAGWDMTLVPNPVSLGEHSFREANTLFPVSLETLLGNDFGMSPVVVRFQGARAIATIDNLCAVELTGPDTVILPGSLTGWVEHPAELNGYFTDPTFRSNMIRFQIIFDSTQPTAPLISAVTRLELKVLPD